MYGGCGLDHIVASFNELTSGSTVVMGVEMFCYDHDHNGCENYPTPRREEILQSQHLTTEMMDSWRWSRNDHRQKLQFLNSGFYMGRAGLLKKFYDIWLSYVAPIG